MTRLVRLLCLFLLFVPLYGYASDIASQDERLDRLDAMREELERSQKKLKLDDYPPPYFMSYQLKIHEAYSLQAQYGSLFRKNQNRSADLYVEVRVGDYASDNSSGIEHYNPFVPVEGPVISTEGPVDGDTTALRNALWALTDSKYREALNQYLQRRGKAVFERPDSTVASFSREKGHSHVGRHLAFEFDEKMWIERLNILSDLAERFPEVIQSKFALRADKETRYYVNTEGASVVEERILYAFSADAEVRAEDDTLLTNSRSFYSPDVDQMLSIDQLTIEVTEMFAELVALRTAPVLDPYTGPAVLSSRATGVLFHEVIGHRLEGERQNSDEEGRTFKGQIGLRILPPFLTIIDDPTLEEAVGFKLNGHYLYDEEGVPARRVVLVEKGRLLTYLMSRTPVDGVGSSNGHGRSSSVRRPMARMGNTIVQSSKAVTYNELELQLLELVKKQQKPYGLILQDMEGGSTNTSTYGYQAFKGTPRIAWRIFPDGKKELVRGVEMVGTPLTSINNIILTSDQQGVFNGFCGAESGWVPVSTIAPAILLDELELQRKKEEKSRPPILKSPYNGK